MLRHPQLRGAKSVCAVRGNAVCGAHSAHVTGVAEEMRVQGEALRPGFVRELLTTLLREENDKNTGGEVSYQDMF